MTVREFYEDVLKAYVPWDEWSYTGMHIEHEQATGKYFLCFEQPVNDPKHFQRVEMEVRNDV